MKKALTIIYGCATAAAAYTNATMTEAYSKFIHNDPVGAIKAANVAAWGDWFYVLLAMTPFIGMVIYQRSIHLATIWLTIIIAAYGPSFITGDIPHWIFYLLAVVWFMSILVRALSPYYTN